MTVERVAKQDRDDAWHSGRDPGHLGDGRLQPCSPCLVPLFLALYLCSAPLMAQELIVNGSLPDVALTRNEALLYFTGRLQLWPNGMPVKVFVLPDSNLLHREFVKSVLGLYPYQLRRVWDRQVYSGTGQAPILVGSEQEMIERVASTAGGIGYAHSEPDDGRVRPLEVH
ncbi:hypothetical protein [Imhoffiella purpurea]|uniref:PBP domain-containing protein n=1 Tax=Imhoffiella purpurea TaxID=1249627 RepID=W9V728_9GAMM|nr:hypothetical protein [Imhoffiella purpurea]EXJ15219.1 hypothetical protein D779_1517 [Imhoffiella purpurea]